MRTCQAPRLGTETFVKDTAVWTYEVALCGGFPIQMYQVFN